MNVLGIDIGTGGTRAVVVDSLGKVVASAVHEHQPFASPRPAWAEQDPHDWWNACQSAIRKVLKLSQLSPASISCVGLTGQMHGAVLLDQFDKVLRPAIIWCDQRSAEEAQELTDKAGATNLIEWTCNPALTNFTITKLLWVRKHEPEIWKRFRSLLLPKDYIRMRLTGERAIDVADASGTLLLDVKNRRWSREVLNIAELPESCLPRLFESQEIVGRIHAEGASATGLIAGTPVVAGAGDQAAGAIGMGIATPGAVSATIGTSGVVFAATDRPALDPKGRLHTFCHAIPGRWHVMGVTQAAGLSLRWFRDTFGAGIDDGRDPYERLSEEARNSQAGARGVLWAPYLMGERTPHCDPDARAALVGLDASHRRPDIVRAIMEGVAFSLRDTLTIFEEMNVRVNNIRLSGGGARSHLWRQIQADVYGLPVATVRADEGAAYGAALLAGVGIGIWKDVDSACCSVVQEDRVVAPVAKDCEEMQRRYAVYRKIYPSLAQITRK